MNSEAGWSPLGGDDTYRYSATTLSVFWPRAEHEKLIAKWPHLAAEVGATWNEHRQRIERHCALVERAGHTVNQVSGDVVGLEAFVKDSGVSTPSAQDLQAYPDLRTQPVMVRWPPARTAVCWCGSGRKYKQCCRPHGLGTLD
ncbi:MAG: SEC-C domain-containing protein [Sciscionella sp.]